MRRIAIGIIAVALLGTAALLTWFDLGAHETRAACARVGFIMVALWIALPAYGGRAVNWWLVGIGLLVALGFTRLPRPVKFLAVASLPVLLALSWPRKQRKR
ncbi:MAG TPA: hypothetical protein VJT73_04035 [Polyangiaceae bacterium]|nr:hypothetical protein [Polyangiaceae bacterium]